MKADGESIVFDQLPMSNEIEAAQNRNVDSSPEIKFAKILQWLPLSLDQLSRNILILESPRASYTNSAQRRGIQGLIPVNIEFLATGDIGKIVVDDRLDKA